MAVGEKTAHFLIRYRWQYIILCTLLTVVALVGSTRMEFRTSFSDLLPKRSKIIDTFKQYAQFSTPINVQILIKVKKGTIYTPDTLARIWRLTREIDLIPSIDHVTVTSIASSKIRVTRATPEGAESIPVMPDIPPKTVEGALEVRDRARIAPGVTNILVSPDEKSAALLAGFHESGIDFMLAWNRVHEMLAKEADPNIEYYPAGRVMLIGWVYYYGEQAAWIFLLSFALITIAHVDYMRSLAGAATPLIACAVSAIWGVGAGGWMGLNLEPLTLVVPVLLIARALSHSLQMTRRYYEILYEVKDKVQAAGDALASMFAPACLGIMCDVVGLYMTILAPIPIVQKLGVMCGTWSLLLIPSVVMLTPCLLAVLPPPKDVSVFITHEVRSISTHMIEPVQAVVAKLVAPGWRFATLGVLIVLGVIVLRLSSLRAIGNTTVGTPLLWPNSEFNTAEAEINKNLAGTVTLNVVWEGKVPHALKYPETFQSMQDFQRTMEAMHATYGTLSISDYLRATNRLIRGGDPGWLPVDLKEREVANDLFWTLTGHSLEDVAQLATANMQNGDVVMWYKDLRSSTVDGAMAAVQKVLAQIEKEPSKVYRVRLAAGSVALQYAMDQVVIQSNWRILVYLLAAIFFMCVITYSSAVAAIMLLVPLAFAQFSTDAVMYMRGLGLDVNTLPVVAVGLGVGIDYGIYLVSRMCDEFQRVGDGDVQGAVIRAILTTGEATFFVAFTMIAGVLPWYFFSNLAFLADMGWMLAWVMLFNCILAMVVLPIEVVFVKPKFLGRVKLMTH
ncbi:MAG TPA: MMPL family transporter [Candidatus Binataceae bacterium]|nr:MMPL family transporter [Candidatus Binataceae bacterium]